MKKQLKRAIFCAICMIVVGVMCLTGVTYAWFTDSKTAIVEGMEINSMTAVGGILLSTDPHGGQNGDDWSYSIPLFDYTLGNFMPASTHPDTLSGGRLNFYKAVLDPENPYTHMQTEAIPNSSANAKESGYYIEKTIYMNNSEGEAKATVSLQETTITTDEKKLNYATRVAIVDHGEYELGTTYDISEANADAKIATSSDAVQVYENNALDTYTLTKREKALPTYGVCGTDTTEFFEMQKERTGIIKLVDNETDPTKVLLSVEAGKCRKITVYVWVEGQDADCLNKTSGAKLTAKIGFTLVQ